MSLKYLDDKPNTYLKFFFAIFITNFIQHIPNVNTQISKYYGIVTNRVQSALLSILYRFLSQNKKQSILPSYFEVLIFTAIVCFDQYTIML